MPVDDEELSLRVEPFPDVTANRPEHALISRAFTSLPERWRTVLWQVEVEGERPAAVAPSFGLSPNAMAALARRAREGLRAAYLQAHLTAEASEDCRATVSRLGNYVRGDLAEILHASPPQGNDLDVDITPTGLTLTIDSGTLVIR